MYSFGEVVLVKGRIHRFTSNPWQMLQKYMEERPASGDLRPLRVGGKVLSFLEGSHDFHDVAVVKIPFDTFGFILDLTLVECVRV